MSHKTKGPKMPHVPAPAKNLGDHLKAPKSGEIVTTKIWKRP